LVYNPSKIS